MGFYERITHNGMAENESAIPVHAFIAALGELERGKLTTQQVIDAFSLTPAEQVDAASLIAKIVTPLESISLGAFVSLTNVGVVYDAINASRGLGIVRIESAGITGFEFGVSVNKFGTGVQSWQLWDETNAAEVAVIDDNGATGNKQLSVSTNLAPLPPGLRTLRVRVKSTVAADDPLYYGASLLIRRIEIMTSQVLHEILLLAESRISPLNTVAAIKTRLGI